MKIAIIQYQSVCGDIPTNISNHLYWINRAIGQNADVVIFPELSLTGYEPTLAKDLTIEIQDGRLDEFQVLADSNQIIIGVGIPLRIPRGICISMAIFKPHQNRSSYSKKHLHPDEVPYFVLGINESVMLDINLGISIAICYEISIEEHVKSAFNEGAKIYLTSVAKSIPGIDQTMIRLSDIARKYGMTVLMSNAIGEADGVVCAGNSSIWNTAGDLVAQLNGTSEGILIRNIDDPRIGEI
ncbi:MAG: putative amidohydrolase [Cyclobacteriaceae bacterium]|jgi:predicted amidohydrolase